MPIYEYRCPACHHRFAVLQRLGEGNERLQCEQCGAPQPVKQFSTFAAARSEGRASSSGVASAPANSNFT